MNSKSQLRVSTRNGHDGNCCRRNAQGFRGYNRYSRSGCAERFPVRHAAWGLGTQSTCFIRVTSRARAYMALGAAMATGKPGRLCRRSRTGRARTKPPRSRRHTPVTHRKFASPARFRPRQIGKDWLSPRIAGSAGILRGLTNGLRINTPAEAPALTRTALREAVSGRLRPVALERAIDASGRRKARLILARAKPPSPQRHGRK